MHMSFDEERSSPLETRLKPYMSRRTYAGNPIIDSKFEGSSIGEIRVCKFAFLRPTLLIPGGSSQNTSRGAKLQGCKGLPRSLPAFVTFAQLPAHSTGGLAGCSPLNATFPPTLFPRSPSSQVRVGTDLPLLFSFLFVPRYINPPNSSLCNFSLLLRSFPGPCD